MIEDSRQELSRIMARRDEAKAAIAEAEAALAAVDVERDKLIRRLRAEKMHVEDIAKEARLSPPRIYQILKERR